MVEMVEMMVKDGGDGGAGGLVIDGALDSRLCELRSHYVLISIAKLCHYFVIVHITTRLLWGCPV